MNNDDFFHKLGQFRKNAEGKVPRLDQSHKLLLEIIDFLFPIFSNRQGCSIQNCYDRLSIMVRETLMETGYSLEEAQKLTNHFLELLPQAYDRILSDANAIFEGDPAAESLEEVIVSYPGFYAICIYRIANVFHCLRVPILPRLFTEYAHQRTGIDIHPGANIDLGFCIDHGTGVVIGETAIIGKNVKIYQGVTLGALSVRKEDACKKRHPSIEDNVTIYAGSTILGGETVVGHDSVIGGNVWLTHSVEPFSTVLNKAEISVREKSSLKGKKC